MLYNKYRPRSLSRIIGHEAAVSALKGYLAQRDAGKAIHSSIMFLGPPSAGKTTLARAFARNLLGEELSTSRNYVEINVAQDRTMEGMRGVASMARLKPVGGASHRVILLEEFQGILGAVGAANAFLPNLENPPEHTIYLLTSMEADKFTVDAKGKALTTRCLKFILKPPTEKELLMQASRIVRGEGLSEVISKELLRELIHRTDGTYREVANLIQAVEGMYEGMDPKPEVLNLKDLQSALTSTCDEDDALAAKLVIALLRKDYKAAVAFASAAKNKLMLINKLTDCVEYLLQFTACGDKKPPGTWASKSANLCLKPVVQEFDAEIRLDLLGRAHAQLVNLKIQSGAFAVSELSSVLASIYHICKK